jgi:hypothetical protein
MTYSNNILCMMFSLNNTAKAIVLMHTLQTKAKCYASPELRE